MFMFFSRLDWPGLVNHPFWQGELMPLAKDFSTQGPSTLAAGGLDVQASNASMARTSSVFDHGGGSVLGRVKGLDSRRSVDRPNLNLDVVDGSRPGSEQGNNPLDS